MTITKKARELVPGDWFDAERAIELELESDENIPAEYADTLKRAAECLWFEVFETEPMDDGRLAIWASPHNVFADQELEVAVCQNE